MTGFLDSFLQGEDKTAPLKTDPLPAGEHDMLMLDPALFGEEAPLAFEKVGSCGNACGGCSKRGTPECDSHHEHDHDHGACGG